MNVYDFDKTIYRSDSTVDFYCWCMKKHPGLIRYVPIQVWGILKYKLRLCSKERMKEYFFSFLKGLKKVDTDVQLFVKKNLYKMEAWYLKEHRDDDVIISASPAFLIQEFSDQGTGFEVIATEVDRRNGCFLSPNCYGAEKVRRFRLLYPETAVDKFYTDSLSDLPMAQISNKPYRVSKGKVRPFVYETFENTPGA